MSRPCPRRPRLARVLALVRRRALRRWACGALSLALTLSCLLQSLPVAAYQARPQARSSEGFEAAYSTTVDALRGSDPLARVIGPAEGSGTLPEESSIEGITVYGQDPVSCASPSRQRRPYTQM